MNSSKPYKVWANSQADATKFWEKIKKHANRLRLGSNIPDTYGSMNEGA